MIEIVEIELKDICYYGDMVEFDRFYIIKEEDFEEKYKKLEHICKNYEDFEEIGEFVNNNFKTIDIEYRVIEV